MAEDTTVVVKVVVCDEVPVEDTVEDSVEVGVVVSVEDSEDVALAV